MVNPPNGWIQNTNNWPYSAAGPYSPKRDSFPRYMDAEGENARGVNAMRVLQERKDFTLQTLRDAAYETRLAAFERLIPTLLQAYDAAPASDPLKPKLAEPIAALRGWDFRWAVSSVPTSLAVYWGEALFARVRAEALAASDGRFEYLVARPTPEQRLQALAAASDKLVADFGTWRTPGGEINRFQRRTGDIVQPFSDSAPSIAVGFTSGLWGSLAAFAGLVLWPFLIMLAVGMLYDRYGEFALVQRALTGISAVAVALVIANATMLASILPRRWRPWLFLGLAFVGIGVMRLPLIAVLAVLAPFGVALAWREER